MKDNFEEDHMEFKVITEYFREPNINISISLFNYVHMVGITKGEDLNDILFFSIYHITNQNNNSKISFLNVFKNLKMFILLNGVNSDLPIFYFQTIYKSIVILNQTIIDHLNKSEGINDKLEEILEFLPIINEKIKVNSESIINDDLKLLDAIKQQIKFFYNNLLVYNEENKFNKQIICFYLDNINPLIEKNKIGLNKLGLSEKINKIPNKIEKINKIPDEIEKIKSDKLVYHEQLIKKESNSSEVKIEHHQEKNVLLTSKTKRFNENHYTRIKFKEKFLKTQNIEEKEIHEILEIIIWEKYRQDINYYTSIYQQMEVEELGVLFKTFSSNCYIELEMIGSFSLKTFTNLENRTVVDLLLTCNYDNLKLFLNKFTTVNDIIKHFQNFNDMESFDSSTISHYFNFDNLKNKHLEELCINCMLYSKRTEKNTIINIFLIDEKLKLSNFLLKKIFESKNVQLINVFFQEILIKKVGICYSRFDISLLIISFLDLHYGLFQDSIEVYDNCQSVKFDENDIINNKDVRSRKFEIVVSKIYYYNINSQNYELINSGNLGELIIEFFRYILNFLIYLKFSFNKSKAKDCEILESYFNLKHLKDKEYLFNLEFMYAFLTLNQSLFNEEILPRISILEDIFFKICENSNKINDYSVIINNIVNKK